MARSPLSHQASRSAAQRSNLQPSAEHSTDQSEDSQSVSDAIDQLFSLSIPRKDAGLTRKERWRKRVELLRGKSGQRKDGRSRADKALRYARLFPVNDSDHGRIGPMLDRLDRVLASAIAQNLISERDALLIIRALLSEYSKIASPKIGRESRGSPTKSFPDVAPELWSDRDLNKRENPMQFAERVYGRVKRSGLRDLDMDLYRAISVWLHRHPEDAHQEVQPEKERMNDIIERLRLELSPEELRRLGYAIDARFRKKS